MSEAQRSPAFRWAYGVGDFGQNILFQVTAFHLLYYLTESVGVGAGFVGSLFLLARIWDGINDPLMGYLATRTHSRWGSYRPYLLIGAPLLGLAMYLLFAVPEAAESLQRGYIAAVYIGFGMIFTLYNVPYGSLTAVMTDSYRERGILTGYRMTFAMLGGIVGATAFLPLVAWLGGGQRGYTAAGLIFALIIVAASLPTFFGVRERRAAAQERLSFAEARRYLRDNGPFWWLCLAFGCAFAAYSLYAATLPYATEHLFGAASLTTPLILTLMSVTAIAVPVWTWLSTRLGKRSVFLWGAMGYGLAYLALGLLPRSADPAWLFAILAIQGLGNGAAVYTSWAMLPDTVEFGQWKSGRAAAGLSYGVYGFFFKLGLGVGAALAGGLLAWSGYQAGAAVPAALPLYLRLGIAWLPLTMTAVAWLAVWKYPITAALHEEIRQYLAAVGAASSHPS